MKGLLKKTNSLVVVAAFICSLAGGVNAAIVVVEVPDAPASGHAVALDAFNSGDGVQTVGFINGATFSRFATGNVYDVRDFTNGEFSQGDDRLSSLVHNIGGITFYENGVFINGASAGVNYFRLTSFSYQSSPYIVVRAMLSSVYDESRVTGYAFTDDFSELNISAAVSAFSTPAAVPFMAWSGFIVLVLSLLFIGSKTARRG